MNAQSHLIGIDQKETGSITTMFDHRHLNSAVQTVRAGQALAENLRRALLSQPLRHWIPQPKSLCFRRPGVCAKSDDQDHPATLSSGINRGEREDVVFASALARAFWCQKQRSKANF